MTTDFPRYRDLPIDGRRPPRSAWGVFGDDDEVGTLNLLTAERTRRAAELVRKGAVFSLNMDLEWPDPPILGRGRLQHEVIKQASGTDDKYDNFFPQASSQWDALAHVGHPEHGFYNGWTLDDITGRPGSRVGIDHWARRGIVGRFVLADIERHHRQTGREIPIADGPTFTAADIAEVLDAQSVQLTPGSILLLRFGWPEWYNSRSQDERLTMARAEVPAEPQDDHPGAFFPSPGIRAEERTAEWLWDNQVAAVAADCPSVEGMPFNRASEETFLHYRLVALLGMALGEMWKLDELAADCAADGVYEGFLTSAPLNKVGGSGSTANAIAVK
jgi:kynurenine formamidase